MSVRRFATVLAVGAMLVSTACSAAKGDDGGSPTGTGSTAQGDSAAPFEGTWTGTWTRVTPVGGGGTLTLVLHQQGTAITGTHTATGGACDLDGDVTGTVDGNTITLKVVKGTGHREYSGTLSGSTLSGSLDSTCPAGLGTGTWQITRGDSATSGSAAAIPSDICGLLTTQQAATVVRDEIKVEPQPAETSGGVTNAGCTWDSLSDKLTVTIVAGVPKDQAALSLQTRAKDNHAQAVSGLGDQAYVFSSIPADAEVDLLVGNLYVTVELTRAGANGLHDPVVTLARAIVSKL